MGIAARRAKDIGIRHARQFVASEPVRFLSVTQPDIAVVRGNLLGWPLAWRPRVSKPDIFTIYAVVRLA